MPTISCILPTYNGAKNEEWLRQSIQSVIDQTYKDWELIIVNDCSTDNTLDILNEYASKDKRIKVISNEVNSKLPASLNHGFDVATGEYYTWTSDDNYYKTNAFEVLLKALQNTNGKKYDVAISRFEYLDDDSNFIELDSRMKIKKYFRHLGACFLYTREIAEKTGKYDTNYFLVEDFEFAMRMKYVANANVIAIDDVLYSYRRQKDSLSFSKKYRYEKAHLMKIVAIIKYYDKICQKYSLEDDEQLAIIDHIKIHAQCAENILKFRYNSHFCDKKQNNAVITKPAPKKQTNKKNIKVSISIKLINIIFFWNKKIRKFLRNDLKSKFNNGEL